MTSMMVLKNITKKYGERVVLSHFNFELSENEFVAIMGPSGAGKSTILNILVLIESFNEGTYTLFGETDVPINTRQSQRLIRTEINYLFQNFALIESETVANNLMIALKYVKKSKSEKMVIIKQILDEVGLHNYMARKVYELSGGEQQRVSIARSIIKPGQVILADEPTGSLDQVNRDVVINLLLKANKAGKAVVIVTHDPEVAKKATRLVTLDSVTS